MRQCNALLKPIREMAEARDFLQPVDWQRYQLNDYPTVIPRPMDLGTIQKKLDMRQYESSQAFVEDVRLVWANAIKYNGAQSPYGQKATTMSDKFDAALHAALNPPASGQRPPPALPPGGLPGGPPPAPPGAVTASSADGRPPIAPMLASPVVATARPSFGGGGGSGFAAGSSSGAFGGGGAVGGASTGGGSAREQLRYTYRRVIQAARQHQVGTLFKQPVPWEKLGLTNYPDIVKQPMDLQTIGKKLENCEYGAFDELKADIDLMFSNAALFNGEASWVKKHIDSCRTFLDKKMAAAAQVTQKQRAAAAGGGAIADPSASARGNVGTITLDDKMLTPPMRLHLYENASRLPPPQLKKFRELVRQLAPQAVEDMAGGDTKIDLDTLSFAAFIRIDTYVRQQTIALPPPVA